MSGYVYSVGPACSGCGTCARVCVFGAVNTSGERPVIEPFRCEGSGACEDVCPVSAVSRAEKRCGELFTAETIFSTTMVYARLIPGEDNSGKLVHRVRQTAQKLTADSGKEFLVIDCPPGIGCPLIASITGVDFLAVIVECSQAGFRDAARLITLAERFRIPLCGIMNKAGLNPEIDREIEEFLAVKKIPLAGRVPFDERFVEILNRKELLINAEESGVVLIEIFIRIMQIIEKKNESASQEDACENSYTR